MTATTPPNLFQAPFRTGIRIDGYQLDPLRKALRLPQVNLFIADDVGLGKTVEAGLRSRSAPGSSRHRRSYVSSDVVYDPLHYLSLLERMPAALHQAVPLRGWKPTRASITNGIRLPARRRCRAFRFRWCRVCSATPKAQMTLRYAHVSHRDIQAAPERIGGVMAGIMNGSSARPEFRP